MLRRARWLRIGGLREASPSARARLRRTRPRRANGPQVPMAPQDMHGNLREVVNGAQVRAKL
eukprot:496254-Pyramimonas_sp.AAC.2